MGVLLLFLSLAYVTGILIILLALNWLSAIYLIPSLDVHLWWAIIIFSITPIASFSLKRYFRKNMRKLSWGLKGIVWIVFGVCVVEWLIGLLVLSLVDFQEIETEATTHSALVVGTHLFLMILFYRLSQRIK